MDLTKAKILLEKISALHKNMSLDEAQISSIEKDLIRNYIRQLYECYLELPVKEPDAANTNARTSGVKPAHETPKVEPKIQAASVSNIPPKATTPSAPASEEVRPVPPPKVTGTPTSISSSTAPSVKKAAAVSPGLDQEMDSLFEHKEARELSEKLGERPIKDLSKAMGLNEKILTINELFGGDRLAFEDTMTALNDLKNFEEAKLYLANNVAYRFKWNSKEKKRRAKELIKLIRRRYN